MESKFYGVDVGNQTLDIGCDGHVVTIEKQLDGDKDRAARHDQGNRSGRERGIGV